MTILVCAQVLSSSVANRFSSLRNLGQLYNTETMEEFAMFLTNFLIYRILTVWKKSTERESQI